MATLFALFTPFDQSDAGPILSQGNISKIDKRQVHEPL